MSWLSTKSLILIKIYTDVQSGSVKLRLPCLFKKSSTNPESVSNEPQLSSNLINRINKKKQQEINRWLGRPEGATLFHALREIVRAFRMDQRSWIESDRETLESSLYVDLSCGDGDG